MVSKKPNSALHIIWSEIHELCRNAGYRGYESYGGQGIRVCAEWREYTSFHEWALAQGYRSGLFLVRRDPTGHFSPDNCEWLASPMTAQAIDSKKTRLIAAFGEVKSITAWARDARCAIPMITLYGRLTTGWDPEQAITAPATPKRKLGAFGEEKTVAEWSQDPRCVAPLKALQGRLASGWALERALTTPLTIETSVTAFGETHTLREWVRDSRCLVQKPCLATRIKLGWDPETALTTPTGLVRGITGNVHLFWLTAFGETRYLTDWTRDARCVVSMATLRNRVELGWNPEKALTTPADPKRWKMSSSAGKVNLSVESAPMSAADEEKRRNPHKSRRPIEITAWGETKTLRAWAGDPRCTVSRIALLNRISAGWSPTYAIASPLGSPPEAWLREAFGERKSLRQWVDDPRCVVGYKILCERVTANQWPLETALTTPPGQRRSRSAPPQSKKPSSETPRYCITAFQETKTIPEWSLDSRCCVLETTLRGRLQRGWDSERAITTPCHQKGSPHDITAFGETMPISAWARDPRCVVTQAVLACRVDRSWNAEEALTTPTNKRRPSLSEDSPRDITAFGETMSISAWARDPRCVVTQAVLACRVDRSWNAEEALTTPTNKWRPSLLGGKEPRDR